MFMLVFRGDGKGVCIRERECVREESVEKRESELGGGGEERRGE